MPLKQEEQKHFYVCADKTLAWEQLTPDIELVLARCECIALADPEFCLYGYHFGLKSKRFSLYRITRDADERAPRTILWRELQAEPGTCIMEVRYLSAPPSPRTAMKLPAHFREPCLEEAPPWLEAAWRARTET